MKTLEIEKTEKYLIQARKKIDNMGAANRQDSGVKLWVQWYEKLRGFLERNFDKNSGVGCGLLG